MILFWLYVLAEQLITWFRSFCEGAVLARPWRCPVEEVWAVELGSTAGRPMSVNKSANMADLTFISNVESQPKDGDKLTSSNQGFKSASINISKPYSSAINQTKLLMWPLFITACKLKSPHSKSVTVFLRISKWKYHWHISTHYV